jgi:hypothetical protein
MCKTASRMLISSQRHRAMPNCVRGAVAKLLGPPNRRLQRTALCAREIVAFLKAESVELHLRSIRAPPLKRRAFGR